jgi:hypothetical protein
MKACTGKESSMSSNRTVFPGALFEPFSPSNRVAKIRQEALFLAKISPASFAFLRRNRKMVLATLLLAACSALFAQQPHGNAAHDAQNGKGASQPYQQNEAAIIPLRQQLLGLLRETPTLTSVVARDPSLLADTAYVNRNNPMLGKFLAAHPEIVRNPDYYLFSELHNTNGGRDKGLMREIWPEHAQQSNQPEWLQIQEEQQRQQFVLQQSASDNRLRVFWGFVFLFAFGFFLAALVWLTRTLLEGRRWSRIFRLQNEVHEKIIERLTNSQELLAYIESDAGRRFLCADAYSMQNSNAPNAPAPARQSRPAQLGTILLLLGMAFAVIRDWCNGDFSALQLPIAILAILMSAVGAALLLTALAARLGSLRLPTIQFPKNEGRGHSVQSQTETRNDVQ